MRQVASFVFGLVAASGACTTINLGPSPGLPGSMGGALALHMGSQVGVDFGGDSGLAIEAVFEPRYVSKAGMFGLRTSYFLRTHGTETDDNDTLAGLLFMATGGVSLGTVGAYAGLGFLVAGSIEDARERRADAGAFRAMLGATWWFVADDTFGWGLTTELDLISASGDLPRGGGTLDYTSLAITFGLELGFPRVF